MKNINMKKVVAGAAALGISAMFAGAVVAANVTDSTWTGPTNLTKAVLFTNGVPAYNIIIGSAAMPIDVVWGGNIAAAIGKKAYTTTTTGGTLGDVVVEVGGESTTTTTGDGLYEDGIAITMSETAFNPALSLAESDYSVLHDEDVTGKITGDNSYEIRETETLTVGGNTLFSEDSDVEDFMALIAQGDINYTAEFVGNGIPHNEDVGDYFGTGDDLDIFFMGNKYSIQSISSSGDKLVLVGTGSKTTYNTGDEISVTGTDDVAYTIEVGSSYNNGEKIQLKLMKDGSVVNSQTFEIDDDVEFSGYPLNETISVIDILDAGEAGAADSVTLSLGSGSTITVEDGEALTGYEDGNDKLWEVNVNGDVNYITSINVFNKAQVWDTLDKSDNDAGLVIGDKITMPLNLGTVEFRGLTEETSYDFTIGNSLVKWEDDSGKSHEAQMYEDNVKDDTVTIDGEDYYFAYTTAASGTVTIKNDDSSGSTVGTITGVDSGWVSTASNITGNDNVVIKYKMKYASSKLMLSLEANSYDLGKSTSATWAFVGTAYDLNTSSVIDVDLTNLYSTEDEDAKETAVFRITTDKNVFVFVDPYTEDLAIKDDYSNNSENFVAQAWYDLGNDANTTDSDSTDWTLDQDDADTDMAKGYTVYGASFEVNGAEATAVIPQDDLKLAFFVGGASSSETTLNGGEVTLTEPGTVVTTEDGAISVKLVSGGATGSEAMTPSTWNSSTNRLVYLDNENPAGNMILVGGFAVNTLTVGTYGLEDKLVQSGAYVVGKAANGNIVVAGTDAADTAAAAKELIAAIENM